LNLGYSQTRARDDPSTRGIDAGPDHRDAVGGLVEIETGPEAGERTPGPEALN